MRRGRCAALSLALVAGILGGREASAQNTYADVPFNQGSLFYRPSGAKPPKKPVTTTPRPATAPAAATTATQPRLFRWFSRTPATTAPATATVTPRYYAAPTTVPAIAAQPVQPGYYPAPLPPPVIPR